MGKKKITLDDVFEAVNNGFSSIEKRMATKDDLKNGLQGVETRLTKKIDKVQESVDILEEVDILDVQRRLQTVEKEVRTLNKHVSKTP